MKLGKDVLKFIAILSTLGLSAASCDKAPEITPNFIDPVLLEIDEHSVVDADNFVISETPTKTYPISESKEGFFCIPLSQVRPVKEYWLKKKKECESK